MIKLELEKIAKENLSKYRLTHSINVEKQASILAQKYDEDIQKCEIAGILHDITKEFDDQTQLQMMLKSDIIIPDIVLRTPKLYHSVTGMIYAKQELNIQDEDILNAIRYHTTARANMSKLEKIIYIADGTSIDRTYEEAEHFRELSFVDLDLCMFEMIKFTMQYLIKDNSLIPVDTIEAYNEYALKIKGKNSI